MLLIGHLLSNLLQYMLPVLQKHFHFVLVGLLRFFLLDDHLLLFGVLVVVLDVLLESAVNIVLTERDVKLVMRDVVSFIEKLPQQPLPIHSHLLQE
jgi:hypothetical protein